MENMYNKMIERVLMYASAMNRYATSKDHMRNCTNAGALSELIYMLNIMGHDVDDCTYQDGEYLKCAAIKVNNEYLIKYE